MNKAIVILSLVLISLLSVYWYFESSSKDSLPEVRRFLGDLNHSQVNRLRIIGNQSYDISRAEALGVHHPLRRSFTWLLRQPLNAPVKESNVREIISVLSDLLVEVPTFQSEAQEASVRNDLNSPNFFILIDGDGVSEKISIGKKNKLSGKLFLQRGNTIFLAHGNVITKIESLLADIRETKLLSFNPGDVQIVDALRADSSLRLKRTACNESWVIREGDLSIKADSSFVEKKLGDLNKIKAVRIVPEPSKILQYTGLLEPILILSLGITHGGQDCSQYKKYVLQVGKGIGFSLKGEKLEKKSAFYLKIAGESSVYEIEKGPFGVWFQDKDFFRKKEFLNISKHNPDGLKLEDGSSPNRIKLSFPNERCAIFESLKQESVTGIIDSLAKKKADIFLSEKESKMYSIAGAPTELSLISESCYWNVSVHGKVSRDQSSPVLLSLEQCESGKTFALMNENELTEFYSSLRDRCRSSEKK